MSIRPCSLCNKRAKGKLASAYWSWFTAANERIAWRQLLCSPCLTSTFGPILRKSSTDSTGEATCPGCGGSLADDVDPVFLSLYLPKQEALEYELDTDAACAAEIRGSIVDHGERLANRQLEVRGPSPLAEDPWAEFRL